MTLVRISIEQLVLLVMLGGFSLTRTAFAAENSPIARGEKPKQLNTTRAGEGPAWHAPSFDLYFTGGDRITRFDATGASHVFREPSGGANGLLFDHQGRLVVCEAANRRVTRTEADGAITVLADSYPLTRPSGTPSPSEGKRNRVRGSRRMKFNSPKLIFDWKTSRGPDGFKMDRNNRLFVAAGLNRANPPFETVEPYKAGIYILSSEGELLDFIPVPMDEVTNCAFGGEDLKTLYITAGSTLWSIRVNSPGR